MSARRRAHLGAAAVAVALGLSGVACGAKGASPAPSSSAAASAATTASASPPASAPPPASASAAPSASAPPAASAAPPEDPKNLALPPTDGEELQTRARALFDAIVKDEAAAADPFWFPKEPFIPLKDVKDPGKYWEQLHRTYGADVRRYHKKRKRWDGAKFVKFELGSKPKWVPPGKEANKIGYHRSFHGKLRYEVDGHAHAFDVHTVISWQGRWFITHLDDFKRKKKD